MSVYEPTALGLYPRDSLGGLSCFFQRIQTVVKIQLAVMFGYVFGIVRQRRYPHNSAEDSIVSPAASSIR